ncbi:ylmG homolog protein 2, chloroplastic-like isoform X2 [Salvia hispanica]|uniref:ylmG homolog protein 2, chloroplastic-like isoform X2 n=1 Tax=Salvia hispanica TaxID=49212 RepID=UPI002009AFE0|nr:ylmG homolog protein 2, chloroplastic-like isoform X2 [Salvia hispanica]XP_047977126.1 ylmG homolog protein 2, chloroplastic-like isoform X2 [Salvia hispanica]
MEEERNLGAPNLQIFPISSTPFDFIGRRPAHPFLVREIHKTFASNVENCVKMVDAMRSQNEIVDKVLSFPAYLHSCFQLQKIQRRNLSMVSSHKFAAILPGDSVAGVVVASGLSNFLNIYNTLLIVRLVLTWFPNAPPAVVSPLSTLCDPYLNIFRGLIPPLGGLDLSPVLAFLVLNAFTSTAAALPAELPPPTFTRPTTSQEKWMARLAGTQPKMSNTHIK